jgi:hypothetical protein
MTLANERRKPMSRRLALIGVALGFIVAATAIATVSAIGSSAQKAPASLWTGGRQSLSKRVEASPIDSNMSEDAHHLFGGSSNAETNAHVPLQLVNGAKIEAGLNANGSLCFDVTTPGRAPSGSCGRSVDPNDINGVLHYTYEQPTIFAGLAGDNVRAVDVLTALETVPAIVQNGAFYATVPNGSKIQGWVVTLADGSKTTHNWPPDAHNPNVED